MRCCARIRSASSSVVPTGAVTSRSFVIASRIGRSSARSNWRSRFVMIPTNRPASSTGLNVGHPSRRPSSRSSAPYPGAMCTTPVPSFINTKSAATTRWVPSWTFGYRGSYRVPTSAEPGTPCSTEAASPSTASFSARAVTNRSPSSSTTT